MGNDGMIAHVNHDKNGEVHTWEAHSKAVGILASQFMQSYDPFRVAEISGILHDVGKLSNEFQKYIVQENGKRGSVKHALPGAALIFRNSLTIEGRLKNISFLIQIIIAGHHRGLYDLDQEFNNRLKTTCELQEENEGINHLITIELRKIEQGKKQINEYSDQALSLLTRLAFSALIDADWLDTEAFFNEERKEQRNFIYPSMEKLLIKFDCYMLENKNDYIKHKENPKLDEFRALARSMGEEMGSLFELVSPTGTSKTFSSLSFALLHAIKQGKSNIIVALPLINLTSEIAEIYKKIFGEANVVEDHSAFDFTTESISKIAIENWNRPFVITTTVQLFESLFSNKPAKLRKIHRLANSVLIIDEYHLLPLHELIPILKALDLLQSYFGLTVLLVSATPFPLMESKEINRLNLKNKPTQIIKEQVIPTKKYELKLEKNIKMEEMSLKNSGNSTLMIVNTRKRAQQLFILAREVVNENEIYHLSTALTVGDRKKYLDEIKTKILNGEKILVIATQVMEAGVDISFKQVYRELAPLPSIIQAAGRCNRYSEYEIGVVTLFSFDDEYYPNALYRNGVKQLDYLIQKYGLQNIMTKKVVEVYYKRLLSQELIKTTIKDEDCFMFEKIAKEFKMLNSYNTKVICVNGTGFEKKWLHEKVNNNWWRKVNHYTAELPKKLEYLCEKHNDVLLWTGEYDQKLGIRV